MAAEQSHPSLEFHISNKTRDITLKNRRIPDELSPHPTPNPELPPGSSDSFRFSDSLDGLLIYEAESFTLAIQVMISRNPDTHPHVLQLELSLAKVHLGQLEEIIMIMGLGVEFPEADQTTVSRCELLGKMPGTVKFRAGPLKVTATMSHEPSPVLRLVLEERGYSEEEVAPLELPCKCQ